MSNRRKAVGLLLCLLLSMTAQAQPQVNLLIHPQFNEDIGVRAGVELAIPLSDRWSLTPELQWSLRNRYTESSRTTQDHRTDKHYRDVAHFASLPLRVGVKLGDTSNQRCSFSLHFGPYIAYGLGGTSRVCIHSDGTETKVSTGAFDAEGRYKSRLDYGLNFEARCTIRQRFMVGAFTEIGLRDLYRSNSDLEEVVQDIFGGIGKQNLAIGLTFGYRL